MTKKKKFFIFILGVSPLISSFTLVSDSNCTSNVPSLQPTTTTTTTSSTTTTTDTLSTTATSRSSVHRRSNQLSRSFLLLFLLAPTVLASPLFSPSLLLPPAPASTTEPPMTETTWSFNDLERVELQTEVASSSSGNGETPYHAKPKWINPCGINSQALQRLTQNFGGHYDVTPLTDGELLENVVLAARNALKHSRFFKEDYVSTF